MSTQSTGVPVVEKAEVHTESIQQHVHTQPIDLAPRSSVVQLRTVGGPFSGLAHGTLTAKSAVSGATVSGITATVGNTTSIISVNRNTPLTILPARSIGTPGGTPVQSISRYQIARVQNRPANLAGGQQPASITVTPIQASNFRLTGATVNNGSWIQAASGAPGSYTPLRPIAVGTRTVRSDGKMIHIPQSGPVQHVTQLQMVENKMLKPPLTATPIVNLRAGPLHPQGSTNAGTPVALAPFTIRATNLTNLAIQQRPLTANANSVAPNLQKVITQPAHGTNLHLINAQKLPHAIQTLTPMPRLCLTLSTNANLTPSNSSPVVAVASRQGGTSLIMTPSPLNSASGGNTIPIGAKVFPVIRDGSSLVESIFAQQSSNPSSGVTVSSVAFSGTTSHPTLTSQSGPTNVVLATAPPSQSSGSMASHGQSHPHHHLVQVHGPINVNTSNTQTTAVSIGNALQSTTSIAPGTITSGYFVEKTVLQPHLQHPPRPITIERRSDVKNIVTGSMILTTQHPNLQSTAGQSGTVTIPLTGHGFAHPIPIPHTQGTHHHPMQHGPTHTQILTSLTTSQSQQIPSSISMLTPITSTSVNVGGPSSLPQAHPSHIVPVGTQVQVHAMPTHVLSQPIVPVPPPITGTTTSSSSINTSVTVNNVSTFVGPSITTTSSTVTSVSVSVPITTTTTTTCPITTSGTNSNTLSTSTPVQSPSQAKSTLSPRPSILRKREVADCNSVPLRAQRNLSLNFSVNNSGTGASASASASAAAAAAAAANKENAIVGVTTIDKSSGLTTSGISILKKEFQPPNEESSWQSCSSNSSSGSTTISTTSETAEIQMQQQIQQQTPGITATSLADLTASLHHVTNNSNSNSSFNSGVSVANSQNGIVRSAAASVHQKTPRNSSSAKTQSKDLDRIKCKEKEDCVSPRKKPRKQQLTTSEFLESASPEISFYQAKRLRKNDILTNNVLEGFNERLGRGLAEETPPTKVVYYLKKPQMSLLQSHKITSKPRQNHFHRHCDVKPKEERRPTVNDLANQKNVTTKVAGWKLQQMSNQVDKVIDLEVNVVTSFTSLLSGLDNKVGPNCVDRDLNRIQELLKGNIQRCKVIRDQMSESRSQVIKILDHKTLILDVINRYISKRPGKKRERL